MADEKPMSDEALDEIALDEIMNRLRHRSVNYGVPALIAELRRTRASLRRLLVAIDTAGVAPECGLEVDTAMTEAAAVLPPEVKP